MSSRLACLAALVLALVSTGARAEPRAFAFDGHTLTEHRSGATADGSFAEFTRQQSGSKEMFLVRRLDGQSVASQAQKLVSNIRKDNPNVQLRVFERTKGSDIMMLYLLTPDGGDPSLVLWRLFQSDANVIATVYRLDFGLDDDEAKAKVTDHSAERAFARLDGKALSELLPARN